MDYESQATYPSCPICKGKLAKNEDLFCPSHQTALENMREGYRQWAYAYGSLTKEEYVLCITKNANTGRWVVEVVQYLLDKRNVEML